MHGGPRAVFPALAAAASLLGPATGASEPIGFVPIELPSTTSPHIDVNDMTPDGAVAVGNRKFSSARALRWNEGVIEQLSFDPFGPYWSRATGITPDGSVIVGHTDSSYSPEPVVWRDGAVSFLPRPDSIYPYGVASDVSADGETIVGTANYPLPSGNNVRKFAVRWTGDALAPLPDPPGELGFTSSAWVSEDGLVTGGFASWLSGGKRAVRWIGDVAEIQGSLSPDDWQQPFAMSANGRVIVGASGDRVRMEAARWKDGVPEGLGDLPGGAFKSRATNVTGDGRVVFGTGVIGPAEDCRPDYACGDQGEAFVWTAEMGMLPLEEWLRHGCGYDLVNWHIGVHAVSGDGTRLAVGVLPSHTSSHPGLSRPYLVDIGHCDFDYDVPEWITRIGDYYLADYDESAIYRMHGETGELDLVTSFGEIYKPVDLAIAPDGALYVLSSIWNQIVRLDPETGEQTIVTSGDLLENPNDFVLGADGTIYALNPIQYRTPARIVRIDPATGEQSVLSEGGWVERDALARGADGGLLTLALRDDVWWLVGIDVETGAQSPRVALSVGSETNLSQLITDTGGRRVFARGGASEVAEIDPETGAVTSVSPEGVVRYDIEPASGAGVITISYKTVHRVDVDTREEEILQAWGHFQQPIAAVEILARCGDGLDNDGDGLADAEDPGCRSTDDDGELHRSDVAIDIEPRDPDNEIRLCRRGRIRVAVLGSDTFDVRDLDDASFAFGPTGAAPLGRGAGALRDLDGDGHDDRTLRFATPDTGIALGDAEACLTGEVEGVPFRACEVVRVVPERGCEMSADAELVLPAGFRAVGTLAPPPDALTQASRSSPPISPLSVAPYAAEP
jgi:hypothetical protein